MLSSFAEVVNYSYTTTSSGTGHSALSGAVLVVLLLLVLVVAAIMIASMWKVFTKAGEAGWKSLIPVYNTWVVAEIAGKPGWWGLGSLLGIIPIVGPILAVVVYVLIYLALAKSFGKDTGFGVLLILLPIVGLPILAFGPATYQGTKFNTMGDQPTGTPAV